MAQSPSKALVKLNEMAQILDTQHVFDTGNRKSAAKAFVTSVDHRSKNTYNTVSMSYPKSNVQIDVITIRTNGELGIVEVNAKQYGPKENADVDLRNLNRQLSESLRF